jgi:hypothetical protein
VSALDNMTQTFEDHHRAVGGFLKYIEAAITDLRFSVRYLNNPEVDKVLDGINKAIQKARPVLDQRLFHGVGGRPGGDTYFGEELAALHRRVYEIETGRKSFHENVKYQRDLIRRFPSEDPWMRGQEIEQQRREGKPQPRLSDEVKRELADAIADVMSAAHGNPQLLPGDQPAALIEPPMADRHATLRTALLENPDQPQAAFVKLCRVHPSTVRRTQGASWKRPARSRSWSTGTRPKPTTCGRGTGKKNPGTEERAGVGSSICSNPRGWQAAINQVPQEGGRTRN